MKRIDSRTVEFTEAEMAAHDRFNELLDKGHGIPFAAKVALNRMAKAAMKAAGQEGLSRFPKDFPSDEFIAYLSDGTCERWGFGVHIKEGWR